MIGMGEFRRTIICSKCGKENYISIGSDIELTEILIAGVCPQCGNTLQLNFKVLEREEGAKEEPNPDIEESQKEINLSDDMFNLEIPSNEIKELIEEQEQ